MSECEFDFTIPDSEACRHRNIHVESSMSVVEYCPKGCDGETMIDLTVTCKDCCIVLHEEHTGHEGCKYGRR